MVSCEYIIVSVCEEQPPISLMQEYMQIGLEF